MKTMQEKSSKVVLSHKKEAVGFLRQPLYVTYSACMPSRFSVYSNSVLLTVTLAGTVVSSVSVPSLLVSTPATAVTPASPR